MKRPFKDIISSLKESIATYSWFVNFNKVYKNVSEVEIPLNILNSLIGKEDFDSQFIQLIKKYPEVVSVIPLLVAVRQDKIKIIEGEVIEYLFKSNALSPEEYLRFVIKTGLKEIFTNNKITNLVDYVTGVEVGLDTNARKNRTGTVMEDLVEEFLKKESNIRYLTQANKTDIVNQFNTNFLEHLVLSEQDGKANKKFDFAVTNEKGHLFLIETNFYSGGGSKLNETARSYAQLADNISKLPQVSFVWITDGKGWISTQRNLLEAYGHIEHLYTITDLEEGILSQIFNF
jgi:type II restriction enzyme